MVKKPIDETAAEALRKTYEKAFSKPKKEAEIKDPEKFFADSETDINIENILLKKGRYQRFNQPTIS